MEEEKSEEDIRYVLHMCNTLMMYEEQSETFSNNRDVCEQILRVLKPDLDAK